MRLPEFITFTGVDDSTRIEDLLDLSYHYPVECGALFSKGKAGNGGRYPKSETIRRLTQTKLRLSAHLCGEYAQDVLKGEYGRIPIPGTFERIQINSRKPNVDFAADFGKRYAKRVILQCSGASFPPSFGVAWIYDTSGGKGIEPGYWPNHPGGDVLVGYAGGIGPDNILEIINKIVPLGPYWLDMETKIRSAGDKFDVSLCRRVCEQVYQR